MDDNAEIRRQSLERTLKRLYKCRDLEISNLWQRSIFLGTFLILCFTGYGFIFMKLAKCPDNLILLIGALVLSIIGGILSLIWIMMAKGSKAWYEVYETSITSFENTYADILSIPPDFIMGELHAKGLDKNIFSTKGGAFSVSKINIAIGQIGLIIWRIILVIQVSWLSLVLWQNTGCTVGWILISIIIIIIIIVLIFTFHKLKSIVRSGFLTQELERQKKIRRAMVKSIVKII